MLQKRGARRKNREEEGIGNFQRVETGGNVI